MIMSKSIYALILATAFFFLGCYGKPFSPKLDPVKGSLGAAIEIPLGAQAIIESENLKVEFRSVLGDNRCPSNVSCFWQGIAGIELKVITNNEDTALVGVSLYGLTSDAVFPNELSVDTLGYLFTLVNLDPYPVISDDERPFRVKNYVATLRILRTGDDTFPNPAILSNRSAVDLRMDEFDLDSASISGKTISLDVVYGGGCETHYFSLYMNPDFFAESNPVQANLYLVHYNNEDFCLALVHNTVRFDIRPIINRQIELYGNDNPIQLNIFDYEQTPGNQISVLYTPPEQ